MSLPIFYISEPVAQPFITLDEETSKHVVQVLRMKKGEQVNLSDGKGTVYHTAILDDHKKRCTVNIINAAFHVNNKARICIAISLLKNTSRFEWFLEKATEIGISQIIPLLCNRTEKQHFRFERMNNILISAMLQSQQYWLPVLNNPASFNTIVTSSEYEQKFIAHCEEEQKQTLKSNQHASAKQILIGPEGDFTKDEISMALQHDFIPVTLGQTRLRTETAGVVAATLLAAG